MQTRLEQTVESPVAHCGSHAYLAEDEHATGKSLLPSDIAVMINSTVCDSQGYDGAGGNL